MAVKTRIVDQMKAVIGIAFLATISVLPAHAAANLACAGEMNYYEPKRTEVSVPPGATIIDLEGKHITTPVGDFRIHTISEDSISFDDPKQLDLEVFGTLDRITGVMRIFWKRPNNNSKMARYAELKCSAAKRLF